MSEGHPRSRDEYFNEEPLPQRPETGKKQIEDDEKWAECWVCFKTFGRQRKTTRWCYHCHRGFCEGEHGSWQPVTKGRSRPLCVVCQYRHYTAAKLGEGKDE